MSVRFSSATQYFDVVPNLGSQSKFTVTCWVKLTVDRNALTAAWIFMNADTSQYVTLVTSSDGTTMRVIDHLGTDITGPNMTVGTWYFFGVSWNGANGTMVHRALDAATTTEITSSVFEATYPAYKFAVANDPPSTHFLNGCLCAVKVWIGTTLTSAQMQQEMWSVMPKAANPTFWYPLLRTEAIDYSGNGYTLTGGSGTATEDGPAIGWGSAPVTLPIRDTIEVVIGQATSTETAQPVHPLHEVGRAFDTEFARATAYTVEVNTATESDIPIEVLDPIAIGVTPLTASAAAASAQSWSTASVAPGSQRLVLLCVVWAASTAVVASPIASVTGCGLTWVLVLGQNYGAATGTINARHRMEVWRALGTTPTAGAITVTHAAAQPGIGRCWSVFELFSTDLSGTNGSGAIRQTASNRSTAASALTATLGAFGSTSNATIGFGAGGNVMTVGTPGFVAITAQRSTSVPDVSLITEWFLGADTTVNVNQTTPTDQMGVIGIEVKRRIVEPLLPGPVTEVDTAQAIARVKGKAAGQVSSTHTAQAVTARRIQAFGMATTTNTAQAIVRPILTATVNQTTLINTAQAITARKTLLVGQATSSQMAQAVSQLKAKPVGQVTGTHVAQAISVLKVKPVGQASSTHAAQAISRLKTAAVGQASGVQTAQAVARLKILVAGRASALEEARQLTAARAWPLSGITETQTARAVAGVRVYAVTQVATSEQARSFTALKVQALAQATGIDTAQAVTPQKLLLVGQTSSSGLALSISALKTQTLSQVEEMGSALTVEPLRVLQVAQAVETTLASSIGRAVGLARALATEAARAIGQTRGVLRAVEPQLATDIVPVEALAAPVGQVADVGAARPLSPFKGAVVFQAVSSSQARTLAVLPRVGRASEIAQARPIAALGGLLPSPTEISLTGSVGLLTLSGSVGPLTAQGSFGPVSLSGRSEDVEMAGSHGGIELVGSR